MTAAALLPRVRAMLADRPTDLASDADLLRAFVTSRDERAFATLVRRHGPLVLAAARRGTGNPADADDVFQATFLLLARNAATIRNRAAVAGWLHGVASRMARTARRAALRRRTHEARAQAPAPSAHSDLSWREVQALFEAELARLPDRYRVPFVLCALNGEPRAEVASQLGVKEGTISSRLAEAKRRLQDGLGAREVSLSAVLGAVALPGLVVSRELVDRTVDSAATGSVPASVSALLRGSLMTARNVLLVVALVLSAGVFVAAVGAPPEPATKDRPAKEVPQPPVAPEKLEVRGTVLDADGKPVAGAPVRLWSFRTGEQIPDPVATTDATGAFRFNTAPQDLTDDARVVVTPSKHPAHWLPLSKFTSEQTLRLPLDDVPFTGRVASLENQPLKGITVEVVRVGNVEEDDLTKWLERNVAMRKESRWLNERGLVTVPGGLALSLTKTTTDADGKFRLTGFGRDRILTVKVYGPNVETKFFWVAARPNGPDGGYIKTRDFSHGVYNPDVTVLLGPSRPLVGTVRDKDGKPVARAVVSEVNNHIPRAITDKDGRYRLEGVPKKSHYGLNVSGVKSVPIFDHTHMWVNDIAGLDPLETNLTVTRGVELTGRVVDADGKPVQAGAMYFPHGDRDQNQLTVISSDGYRTKPDGTFYLTVHPGPGVLTIQARYVSRYVVVDPGPELDKIKNRGRPGPTHAAIPIDVDPSKPESITVRVQLEASRTVKGTVVGPDGKPLSGARAVGLSFNESPKALLSAEFTMTRPGPGARRLLIFIQEERKLAAVHTVSGDSAEPVAVKLAPVGSAAGRVLKPGEPGAEFTVTAVPYVPEGANFDNLPSHTMKVQRLLGISSGPWRDWTNRTTKTDKDGRFKLDNLLPGLQYTIYVSDGDLGEAGTLVISRRGVKVESGKEIDLGTLRREEKRKE